MGPVDVAGCDGLRSVKGGMPDGVLKILRDAGLLQRTVEGPAIFIG
jgi:hypothetical protein